MRTADFHFDLPEDRIAQSPTATRDASRLLVVHRKTRTREHRSFPDLEAFLKPGDLLVRNDSRVIPARLRGRKEGTGAAVEILLIEEIGINRWWTMLKPGKRIRPGTNILLNERHGGVSPWQAVVEEKNIEGHCLLRFGDPTGENISSQLDRLGELPLPPYIARPDGPTASDYERYQTIYAGLPGSVAAPTAGLHFTQSFLERVLTNGVRVANVTLHVGAGTFAPVKVEDLDHHVMHEERYLVPQETARAVEQTQATGGRVIAVGTTSLRVLESACAFEAGRWRLVPGIGRTRLFVRPPAEFRLVDGLLTNFHLPESTLLMLVCAFASPGSMHGRDFMLETYNEAVREGYRFFSYGDAMLIL